MQINNDSHFLKSSVKVFDNNLSIIARSNTISFYNYALVDCVFAMLVLLTLMKSTRFYRGIGFWHNHKSNCNPIYVCVCAQCALSHLNQQSPKKNNTVRKNIQPLTVNTPNRNGGSMAWYGLAYYGIVCFLYTLSEMK